MKHARIAVFEDEPTIHNLINITLLDTGHEVAATATTREQALAVVDAVYAGRLILDAVLLDGNLDHHDFSDARVIYDNLKRLEPKPAVVGISAEPLAHHGVPLPSELDITKWQLTEKLADVLNLLPEPKLVEN